MGYRKMKEFITVTLCPCGFMNNILSGTKYRVSPAGVSLMDETNNLASPTENHRWERSPLIHSYGYDYDGHPALALRARFAHANLLPANLSAGDRPTCFARLIVSSMRLTPSGLTRYFVPDKILFIKPNRTKCNRNKLVYIAVAH